MTASTSWLDEGAETRRTGRRAPSSISRSHRQGSAGSGVKDQPEPCQTSGDAGVTSITRNTTFGGGPPGTRTRNLRIKSPLLYPIELEARPNIASERTSKVGVTEGT